MLAVVVSASPAHAFVGEHLLLVELGASVPVRSVTITEADLGALGDRLEAWLADNGDLLAAVVSRTDAVVSRTDAVVSRTDAVVAR